MTNPFVFLWASGALVHVIPLMILISGTVYRGWFMGEPPPERASRRDVLTVYVLVACGSALWVLTDLMFFAFALHLAIMRVAADKKEKK